MTQYRGLSRRIKEEIGRVFCMESHCTVILRDAAEALDYDITNNFTYASFLVKQRRVNLLHDDAFLDYIRGKTSLTSADDRNLESIIWEYGNKKQDEE